MIAPSNIDRLSWLSTDYTKTPITGLILRFPGLGGGGMKSDADSRELEWGQSGGLTLVPYQDPWGWMNPSVLRFVDDVVEAVKLRHHLGDEVPTISTGGSMGGHGALTYALKSRHRIAACMALWPVCDLPFHYSERLDLPRTMHHAFDSYEDITTVLVEHSPLHQVAALPEIPYLLVHGEKDQAVNKAAHSDRLIAAMRERQLQVEYIERPKLGHGSQMDYETDRRITDFVLSHLNQRDVGSILER